MPRKRGRACGTIATQSLSSSIGVGGEGMLQTLIEAEGEFVSTLAGKLSSLQHGNATFPIPISSNNESIWKKKKYSKMLPGHGLLTTSIVQPKFSMGPGEGVPLRERSVFYAALPTSCLIAEFRLECYCLDLMDFAYTPLLSWCKHLSYSVHKFRLSRCVVPMCVQAMQHLSSASSSQKNALFLPWYGGWDKYTFT